MSDEVTTHQIKGFCGGVMMKGDWQEYHIDIGKTYPVKLSTKQDDVKAIASAAGTQEAVWTYTERQGGPNPHRPGEFFKNRYLSKVEVGGVLDPTLATQGGGSTGEGSTHLPSPEGRERSIERQTIIKAAMAVYPVGSIQTDDDWFAFVTRLDGWISAKTAEVQQPAAEQKPTETASATAAVDPDDQDDIPF